MRQFRFDYLLKNITIPSKDNYLRNMIEKVESVLKRIRLKAHFFIKVLKLIENIKFRDTKNDFQETLANVLKKIYSSKNMFRR